MEKPCFIQCLFCLEICGGSAKGFHIQLKQEYIEQPKKRTLVLLFLFFTASPRHCWAYLLSHSCFLFVLTCLHDHLVCDKGVCNLSLSIFSSVQSHYTGDDCAKCCHCSCDPMQWRKEEGRVDNIEMWLQRLMGMLFWRVCSLTWAWITLNSTHTHIHMYLPVLFCWHLDLTFLRFNSQPEDRSHPFLKQTFFTVFSAFGFFFL